MIAGGGGAKQRNFCVNEEDERVPANRDERGRFVKGASGNPSGRPAVPENVKAALCELVPESIAVKKQILHDALAPLDLKNRVADSVLDRVYGKPAAASSDAAGEETLKKLKELLGGVDDAAQS